MTSQTVQILNQIGLHARPASLMVNTAGKFQSDITVLNGERSATAKSIINLLALRGKMDDILTIQANGIDEKEAVDALAALVKSKFGEE